jgi:WASH complex subunit strumpellin
MYGVMLLLLDMRVPGPVRERMIIAYYRYKSNDADNIQEIVRLCRATGFVPGGFSTLITLDARPVLV